MPDTPILDSNIDQPDQLPTQDPTVAQTTPLDNQQTSASAPVNTKVEIPDGGFKGFKVKDWIGTILFLGAVIGLMVYAAISMTDTTRTYRIVMKDGTVEMCKFVEVYPCGNKIYGCDSGHHFDCNRDAAIPPEAIKNFK